MIHTEYDLFHRSFCKIVKKQMELIQYVVTELIKLNLFIKWVTTFLTINWFAQLCLNVIVFILMFG